MNELTKKDNLSVYFDYTLKSNPSILHTLHIPIIGTDITDGEISKEVLKNSREILERRFGASRITSFKFKTLIHHKEKKTSYTTIKVS